MTVKNEFLVAMENDFKKLIDTKGNDEGATKRIAQNIGRVFGFSVTVAVTENPHNEFYGMSVFPTAGVISTVVDEILKGEVHAKASTIAKIWSTNKSWVVEIDELILTDPNLNTNPSELVAVLLHELGHVALSNTASNRFTTVMQYQLTKMNYRAKNVLKWKRAHRLLDLVVIEACTVKNYVTNPKKEELYADEYVYKLGYGDSLHSFITKILHAHGNSTIDRHEKEITQDIANVATFAMVNITELNFRKSKLKRLLESEVRKTPSLFIKAQVSRIKHTFFKDDDGDIYRGVVREAAVSEEFEKYSSVLETYTELSDEFGRIKRIKQIDIDILRASLGKVKTLDDKLFLLDRIKDAMDVLDASDDMIQMKEDKRVLTPSFKIGEFRTQLDTLRDATLKVKVGSYKGFYKLYPVGYEG